MPSCPQESKLQVTSIQRQITGGKGHEYCARFFGLESWCALAQGDHPGGPLKPGKTRRVKILKPSPCFGVVGFGDFGGLGGVPRVPSWHICEFLLGHHRPHTACGVLSIAEPTAGSVGRVAARDRTPLFSAAPRLGVAPWLREVIGGQTGKRCTVAIVTKLQLLIQ